MRETLDKVHGEEAREAEWGKKGKPWTKLSRNPMLQNEELKDEE